MSGAEVRIATGVARTRGTGRDHRPALATPAPRARALAARAFEPWGPFAYIPPIEARAPAPPGQGPPVPRQEPWGLGRLPRARSENPRVGPAQLPNPDCRPS